MKLITQTIVKNRLGDLKEDRKFKEWLDHVYSYSDLMIVLDNDSTDGTLELIENYPDKDNKIVLIKQVKNDFTTEESYMRALLWETVRKHAQVGDVVLTIDSDEFLEQSFVNDKQFILEYFQKNDVTTMLFKFCDMWSENEYRIDGYWSPCFPRLYKFQDENWGMVGKGLHHSNVPQYVLTTRKSMVSQYRVKHYSYHTQALRLEKTKYYLQNSLGKNLEHAGTIMDENPAIKTLVEPLPLPKVLIGCLVRNREWVLPELLKGFDHLNYPKKQLGFYFIVNNSTDKSGELLREWAKLHEKDYSIITIETLEFKNAGPNKDREWTRDVILNMAHMRNKLLQKLKDTDFEYLFSADSDLLLHPDVLKITMMLDQPVVSPVFWAKWKGDKPLPQCWINGGYNVSAEWLSALASTKMRTRCGGLGALTLIHRSITDYPLINYNHVYNLGAEMWGEDRWFCTRASVFDVPLVCHTYIETRHVDKPEDLKEHADYVAQNKWYDESCWIKDER